MMMIRLRLLFISIFVSLELVSGFFPNSLQAPINDPNNHGFAMAGRKRMPYGLDRQRKQPILTHLEVKRGLNMCIPYSGLIKSHDAVLITVLLGLLEGKERKMVSYEFHHFMQEIQEKVLIEGELNIQNFFTDFLMIRIFHRKTR